MSIFEAFSVTYNFDLNNKRAAKEREKEKEKETKSLNHNPNGLSPNLVFDLIDLGYDILQILFLYKDVKFDTVDSAITYFNIDPSTGKYLHNFCCKQKNNVIDSKAEICTICKDKRELHQVRQINVDPEDDIQISFCEDLGSPKEEESDKKNESTATQSNVRLPKYAKITISQSELELFNNPVTCKICYNGLVNKYNPVQAPCKHFFCDDCIRNHFIFCIVNGKVMFIKCLMLNCPRKYRDEEIKQIVSDEYFYKYKTFKAFQLKFSIPNKSYIPCPFPDCQELVDWEEVEDEFVTCDRGHSFCSICRELGEHEDTECKRDDRLIKKLIKKVGYQDVFKQCPKCKIILEKKGYCNKKKCFNCELEFCWLCLKPYSKTHYANYNFFGCPGMEYDTDKGNRIQKEPGKKYLWYIYTFLYGFVIIGLVLLFFLTCGCVYEFIRCYSKEPVDEEEADYYEKYDYDIHSESIDGGFPVAKIRTKQTGQTGQIEQTEGVVVREVKVVQEEKDISQKKNKFTIVFMGFLGVLCQPFYLLFYIFYGIIEICRHLNCWYYYIDV